MSSTTNKKQSTPAKPSATTKKANLKPLTPSEFDATNVEFSNVQTNTEYGTKWVNVSYPNPETKEKQLRVVARGCVIKTFGKMVSKDEDKKPKKGDSKPKREKYNAFMAIKDESFVKMIKELDDRVARAAFENCGEWLGDDEKSEEDCRSELKATMPENDKYPGSYSMGSILSNDFTCKSKTEEVPDVSDLTQALVKNTIVDVCFIINKVKLSSAGYRLGMEITQINIVGVGAEGDYVSSSLKPEDFEKGQIKLGERKQHEKGGKFCKVNYGDKMLRVRLENVNGRIFKFDKDDGAVNYSMCIRLSDPETRKMFEDIDEEIFTALSNNSKDYYDTKKTAKQLKTMVKPLVSFSKSDQDKIAKGQKPEFEPSIWIKIYHSEEKGFDGKIVNIDTKTPFENSDDIVNKDVNITSIEFYSRHVWFSPKTTNGTTVNLTLNKCEITYDVPVYDMDDASDDAEEEEEEAAASGTEEDAEEEEAANSDDEE